VIVTCLPATAPLSDAQFVPSSSSISFAWLTPSPDGVAPLAADAQFVGSSIVSVWSPASRLRENYTSP
jgi:hypothetical protein